MEGSLEVRLVVLVVHEESQTLFLEVGDIFQFFNTSKTNSDQQIMAGNRKNRQLSIFWVTKTNNLKTITKRRIGKKV